MLMACGREMAWTAGALCVSGPVSPVLEGEKGPSKHFCLNIWQKILENPVRPTEAKALGLGPGKFHLSKNTGQGDLRVTQLVPLARNLGFPGPCGGM